MVAVTIEVDRPGVAERELRVRDGDARQRQAGTAGALAGTRRPLGRMDVETVAIQSSMRPARTSASAPVASLFGIITMSILASVLISQPMKCAMLPIVPV